MISDVLQASREFSKDNTDMKLSENGVTLDLRKKSAQGKNEEANSASHHASERDFKTPDTVDINVRA